MPGPAMRGALTSSLLLVHAAEMSPMESVPRPVPGDAVLWGVTEGV